VIRRSAVRDDIVIEFRIWRDESVGHHSTLSEIAGASDGPVNQTILFGDGPGRTAATQCRSS
jgi:hypothetical protein